MARKPKPPSNEFLDPLVIHDRTCTPTHAVRNFLAGGRAFLVCGGPSARQLPLDRLKARGLWSMAINNMAGFVHSNAFISADPPSKFHHGIWLDPSVMKFVPLPKMRGNRSNLREKIGDEFKDLHTGDVRRRVANCPNVWGFGRRSWLETDDTFFTENEAAWGNHDEGVLRTGHKKSVSTLLLGLRVLYYLGARRIYLVGCDWRMTPGLSLSDNYAFGQSRDNSAIGANNNLYSVVGEWLKTLQTNGTFKKFGLEIYNTNQLSGLRAFDYVPFETAISDALKYYPQQPFDLNDWYEK